MIIKITFNDGTEYAYECTSVNIAPSDGQYSYLHFYGNRYSFEAKRDYLFPLKKISDIQII